MSLAAPGDGKPKKDFGRTRLKSGRFFARGVRAIPIVLKLSENEGSRLRYNQLYTGSRERRRDVTGRPKAAPTVLVVGENPDSRLTRSPGSPP